MSISNALSNALSGLTASSRAAGVVSSNLANVLTEGYAPRQLEVVTQNGGPRTGVSVVGITRHVDQALLGERRLADSAVAHSDTVLRFSSQLQQAVGTPDNPASLSARVTALEDSLITAASRPEAPDRLQAAVTRASEVASSLSSVSGEIQNRRTEADSEINRAVEAINTNLVQIHKLNVQIVRANDGSASLASLQDSRQLAIDRLSEFIPIRQVPRDGGSVALFTPGGAILLDSNPATLEFSPTPVVTPQMTLAGGQLSGLKINGADINLSSANNPIGGGRLAALFEVRDDLGVKAQTQVDALARDLIERFQQAGIDPTRAPGDPGLFTDAGAFFSPANEVGIAARIAVNAAVDPGQGGELRRLRDGLGAATPGPVGNAGVLQQLQGALSTNTSLASGDLGAVARSLSGHFGSFSSYIGQDLQTHEQNLSFASSTQDSLKQLELQGGVDSDSELQKLLLIEQSFGANARMIQTIDDMMQTILGI
jgi:flagellar hook-associated protein 1 FlgK